MQIILRYACGILGIQGVQPMVNHASPSWLSPSFWTRVPDRSCPCSGWYHLPPYTYHRVLDHPSTVRKMCSWSIQRIGVPSNLLIFETKNILQAFLIEHWPLHYFPPSYNQCQSQMLGICSPTSISIHLNLSTLRNSSICCDLCMTDFALTRYCWNFVSVCMMASISLS